MKKNILNIFLGKLIFIILLVNPAALVCQTGKPDLIITNVELKYIKTHHIHKPGEPVSGTESYSSTSFFITVKNIGNKEFSDAFYIAYAKNESDFRTDHYSYVSIVNREKFTIEPDDSLIVMVGAFRGDQDHYKFYIPSNGKPLDGDILPLIDEASYDNNIYECTFPGFKRNNF